MPPSPDHFRDWTFYVDGVTLPLSQAIVHGGEFQRYGPAVHQIFADWTTSTTNRIGVMRTPLADQPPALAPGTPKKAAAEWRGGDKVTVRWFALRHDGGSAITGR